MLIRFRSIANIDVTNDANNGGVPQELSQEAREQLRAQMEGRSGDTDTEDEGSEDEASGDEGAGGGQDN